MEKIREIGDEIFKVFFVRAISFLFDIEGYLVKLVKLLEVPKIASKVVAPVS